MPSVGPQHRPVPQTSAKNKLHTDLPPPRKGVQVKSGEKGNQAGSVVGTVTGPLQGGDILAPRRPGTVPPPTQSGGEGAESLGNLNQEAAWLLCAL